MKAKTVRTTRVGAKQDQPITIRITDLPDLVSAVDHQEERMQVTDDRMVLTMEEAAQRLGIGRTTMYALVMNGEIRSVTIGRLRRVPVRCLTEYVDHLLDPASPDTAV
ncbi:MULTISPECIES: helix-turn-helix domain-containing protein [Catenuloplanes]|uniref:Excisionase family DNA binding protein n=1 Tax=Catenuloplanes niger TaxID=587534 RepID=A0AAE3ZQL2_9ACTN|nr:helix-turn-helix domain-containing protein [Catenuloplanes niger]MDR7323282.1 excisionase family DNA binding protein [Catenuloplanes niger]